MTVRSRRAPHEAATDETMMRSLEACTVAGLEQQLLRLPTDQPVYLSLRKLAG